MNIRKPTDYTAMFAALDAAVAAQLPQMELYCEIGRVVSGRGEKGAAAAASEYLQAAYPAADGFSPRNVRRMRDFYRMYGNMPELLAEAMRLNWTQNVVIMEAGLTMDERCWYMNEARFSNIFIEKRASTCPQSLEKSRLFSYALLVSECENFQNMKRIFLRKVVI